MKAPGKLKRVTVDLKFMKADWETDEREVATLRNFINKIRSRRAFQVSRISAAEDPVHFLASITEFRNSMRTLLNDLPYDKKDSRLVLLTAMEWAGEILDAWQMAFRTVAPSLWDFQKLNLNEMMKVMELAWPTIENARVGFDSLASELERELSV